MGSEGAKEEGHKSRTSCSKFLKVSNCFQFHAFFVCELDLTE